MNITGMDNKGCTEEIENYRFEDKNDWIKQRVLFQKLTSQQDKNSSGVSKMTSECQERL